jgi:hypothetical protein
MLNTLMLAAPASPAAHAQVLLNLLIAMLSSTFAENQKDAQQGWKLHRASVLVRIDKSMTEQQRKAADKTFWQTSPGDNDRRCERTHVRGLL